MLHPVVAAAAEGRLPEWARMSEPRLAHASRVATLLGEWAERGGLDPAERRRWMAAGYLHDALRDADPESLRPRAGPASADWPAAALHGPAVAERLRGAGVDDEPFLLAIAYHTLGHPGLGRCGKALFAADFLEPGRDRDDEWRAELRERMPEGMDQVVREILRARIAHQIGKGRPVRPETLAFWNEMAEGEPWARASEL